MLEIASARTPDEIDALVSRLAVNNASTSIAEYTTTLHQRIHLVKPMVCYDTTALALSFLPAVDDGDAYTYHHLRRDVFDQVADTGVEVNSRYVVPSAHVTIARFITQEGSERARELVERIEEINQRLASSGTEWDVGQGRLDFHKGRSWYGGGEAV